MALTRMLDSFRIIALAVTVTAVLGIASGYRPVVLVSGSMAPAMATGSLVVVGPRTPSEIQVGDVVMMERGPAGFITHRITKLSWVDGRLIAITQGDANLSPDPVPYQIDGEQRVVVAAIPVIGRVIAPLAGHRVALGLLALCGFVLGIAGAMQSRGRQRSDGGEQPASEIAPEGQIGAAAADGGVPDASAINRS